MADPQFIEHDTGPGHPEAGIRLSAVMERLETSASASRLTRIPPEAAPVESIRRVHDAAHIEHIQGLSALGRLVSVTPDTVLSPATYGAALAASGGVQRAVDEVMAGRITNAFCALRPPGHHAERDRAMGFCFLNHIAIGARYLQDHYAIRRVAIVDWDVHHGNGTQHSFEDDGDVFYFSIHQYPHYPGTGSRLEQGRGPGRGTTLNVPVSAGTGNAAYLEAFREELRPALDAFHPEFILLSAGFDAHRRDPLAAVDLTESGFGDLTAEVTAMAHDHCQGRVVSMLEGGYDLEALSASVDVHVEALCNSPDSA